MALTVDAGSPLPRFGWVAGSLAAACSLLPSIQQGYASDYGALFAALTITMVPALVVYIIFQRRLESGLTAGALKG